MGGQPWHGQPASAPIPVKVRWSDQSKSDLTRIFDRLSTFDDDTAAGTIQMIVAAGLRLGSFPQMGRRWSRIDGRDARSIIAGHFELLYEIRDDAVEISRVYHIRQNRSFRLD